MSTVPASVEAALAERDQLQAFLDDVAQRQAQVPATLQRVAYLNGFCDGRADQEHDEQQGEDAGGP